MPETRRLGGNGGAVEQSGNALDIGLRHLLLHAIGAETGDTAGNIDLGFVDRITQIMAGIAGPPGGFRRYGSARRLYNFHIDRSSEY